MRTRREFIGLLGAAAAWPLAARAQARRPVRIGTLHVYSPPDPWLEALRLGLRDLGYVEGRNIKFEERWAEGRNERLDGLARQQGRCLGGHDGTRAGSGEAKNLNRAHRHGGKW